ncbi:hypothetical protein [Oleispirillum naphthae]
MNIAIVKVAKTSGKRRDSLSRHERIVQRENALCAAEEKRRARQAGRH